MNTKDIQQLKAARKLMRENPSSHAAFQEYKRLIFTHGDSLINQVESLTADSERWKSSLHKKDTEELAEKEAYSFTVPEIMDATRRYGYSMTNSEVLEALAKEKA